MVPDCSGGYALSALQISCHLPWRRQLIKGLVCLVLQTQFVD